MKKEKQIEKNLLNEINPEDMSFNRGFTGRSMYKALKPG